MKSLLVPLLILLLCPVAIYGALSEPEPVRDAQFPGPDSINGVYIPMDIHDAIREIDGMMDETRKHEITGMTQEEFTGLAHLSLGIGLRNEWGLWSESRLAEYFNGLGIYHPDNMSGIILVRYHRHLTGKPLKIKKQVALYKKSQKKSDRRYRRSARENGVRDGLTE